MALYRYGKNTVLHAIRQDVKAERLVLLEGLQIPEAEQWARQQRIPVDRVNRKILDKLCGSPQHQGIALQTEDFRTYTLAEVLARQDAANPGLLVMLDELTDPHNLGAILRTCDAVGADGVIIRKDRSVSLTPTVAKVSTGAIDTVPTVEVTNLTQTLKTLKEQGYWIYGADAHQAVDYRQPRYDTPVVLVIGSEGKGISRLVREQCDVIIGLPMQGSVTSLNASVACGILLYQIYQQRFPL